MQASAKVEHLDKGRLFHSQKACNSAYFVPGCYPGAAGGQAATLVYKLDEKYDALESKSKATFPSNIAWSGEPAGNLVSQGGPGQNKNVLDNELEAQVCPANYMVPADTCTANETLTSADNYNNPTNLQSFMMAKHGGIPAPAISKDVAIQYGYYPEQATGAEANIHLKGVQPYGAPVENPNVMSDVCTTSDASSAGPSGYYNKYGRCRMYTGKTVVGTDTGAVLQEDGLTQCVDAQTLGVHKGRFSGQLLAGTGYLTQTQDYMACYQQMSTDTSGSLGGTPYTACQEWAKQEEHAAATAAAVAAKEKEYIAAMAADEKT